VRQAETRPNRYILDEQGIWRCPPGEAFATHYGLTYRVWSSDEANWAAQDNALFLEDYYQELERLTVPETVLDTLYQTVDEHPGIMLSDLRTAASTISADLINIAIARHALYVDLATYRLSEPWHTPVFRNRNLARAGSGSCEKDSPVSIIAMEKEEQASLMHDLRLGKGEGHAHKTSETLAQRVIPPLHMGRFSRLFSHRKVLLLWDHRPVRRPEIREAVALPIPLWNGLPQPLTRLFAPISHGIGDHLTCLAAQGDPNPGVVRFFEDKRPQFIEFQDGGSGILWVGDNQGGP